MSAATTTSGIHARSEGPVSMSSGYRQSDIGVIPNDWAVFSIRELFDYMRTASNSRSDLGYTGTVSYVHYGDIHIRLNHFIDFNLHEIPCLSDNNNTTATRLRDGDLIVADASEDITGIGKSVEIRNLGAIEAVSGLHTLLLRAKDERVHHGYRGYLLEKAPVKRQLRRLATGLKVFGISKQSLNDVRIPLPLPAEQRAIAEALSDVDGLLDALDALIAKKRAIKQATMQQLLTGKTRLPGFSGEWETRRLGEIGEISGAGVDKKIRPNEIIIRLVNYLDVYHKTFLYSKNLVQEVSAKQDQVRHCSISKGDVFFTPTSEVRDDIGRSTVAMENIPDSAYSYHVVRLRLNTNWDLRFRAYAFNTKDFYDQASMSCEGSGTRYVITLPKFRAITIHFPATTEEQSAIAAVLSDMDAEIAALEQRRDKTQAAKQGMMQQLLTGKIRLVSSVEVTTRQVSTASTEKRHNWQFNEAVVISVLARRFGNENYPLSRMRYTKLSYLLHRHAEGRAEGYLKKAAGPYNPRTRYRGPEAIALKNGYVRRHENGDYGGFIAGKSIEKAESYFAKWYEEDSLRWLDQFRYEKRDDLELLTTVDLAIEELREAGKAISVEGVRKVIHSDPEWKAKLNRSVFSNTNIARAIERCRRLFGIGDEGSKA